MNDAREQFLQKILTTHGSAAELRKQITEISKAAEAEYNRKLLDAIKRHDAGNAPGPPRQK